MKTPGQIAYEAWYDQSPLQDWGDQNSIIKEGWERVGQAVLSSQWRGVNDPPKSLYETIIVAGGESKDVGACTFNYKNGDRTHWMYPPPLPKPKELTSEEKALKEFKEKFAGRYDLTELAIGRTQTFKFNGAENAWLGFKAGKGL